MYQQINENGFITFGQYFNDPSHQIISNPRHFPLPYPNAIVAVYLADVDITIKGRIYHRVENDQGPGTDVARATVLNHFNNGYRPKATIIATWENVTFDGGSSTSPVSVTYNQEYGT